MSNPEGPNAEIFPDLHLKMSKKIAQLTRVIYHLNAKHEDNAAELASFREQHNSEVSAILEDAMGKLNVFQSQLKERNAAKEAEEAVNKLSKKHAGEKRKAMEQFKNFKARVQDREKAINKAVQEKLVKLRTEVESLREKFASRTKELESVVGKLKNSASISQTQLDELNTKHREEIDTLVKDSNEKYQAMLMQKLDEIDALQEKSNADIRSMNDTHVKELEALKVGQNSEVSEMQIKIAELQKELDNVQEMLGSKLEQLLQNVENLTEVKMKMVKENQGLSDKVNQLQSQITDMQQQLEGKDKQLQDASGSNSKQIASIRHQIAERDAKIRSQDSDMNVLSAQVQEYMSANAKLKKELKNVIDGNKSEMEIINRQLEDAVAAKAASQCQVQDMKRMLDETKNMMAEHIASKVQLEEDKTLLEDKLGKLKLKIASLEKDTESSNAQQNQALTTCRKDLKAATAKISSLQQKISDMESLKAQTIVKHAMELDSLKKQHEDDMETQQTAHTHEITAVKDKLTSSDKNWHEKVRSLERTIEEMQQHSDGRAASLEKELAELRDGAHKELQEKYQIAESEVKVLKRKLDDLTNSSHDTSKKLTELRQREAVLQKQMIDAQDALPRKIEDAKKDAARKLELQLRAEFATTLQVEIETVRKEYEKKIIAMQTASGSAHTKVVAQLEQQVKKLNTECKTVTAAKEESVKRYEDELKKLRRTHQEALNALKVDAERAAYDAEQKHLKAMNTLQQTLEEDRNLHIGELQRDFDQKVKLSSEEHKVALEKMQASMQEELDKLRESSASSFEKQLQDQIAATKAKNAAELEEQLSKLKDEKDQERSELRQKLDGKIMGLGRDVADLTKMCSASETREKELRAENVQMKQRVEDLRKEIQRIKKSAVKDIEASRKKLRGAHKAELENLINEHISGTEMLNNEFQRVQTVMSEQIELLEQRLTDSQDLYSRRSSRPEDLERIAGLQSENAKLASEVAKLMKDMKYYKLELLNREKNFNKLFNASPNVGVMSVLKTGGPTSGPQLGVTSRNGGSRHSKR